MTKDEDNLSLSGVIDELKRTNRRINQLQKTVDLLYADREILEDIQSRLTGVEEKLRLSRQHDEQVRKDIKYEINEVKDRVEAKVGEIGEKLEKKKIITIKKYPEWMFWKRR